MSGASGEHTVDLGSVQVELAWGTRSVTGNVRRLNEDAVLASPPVFVVADGMGGHDHGEVASALAVEAFGALAGGDPPSVDAVRRTVDVANRAIYERSNDTIRGMGTTLTGLVLCADDAGGSLCVVNVGDSRTYRLRAHVLEQLTVDHSAVQELIDAGRLDPSAVGTHPERNVVTRALGVDARVQPDVWLHALSMGDRFLVCSDGLTNELGTGLTGLVSGGSPQECADRLVDTALAGAARDNVSVVVVDVRRLVVPSRRAGSTVADRTDPRADTTAPGRRDVPTDPAPTDPALPVVGGPTMIDDVPLVGGAAAPAVDRPVYVEPGGPANGGGDGG